MSAAKGSSAGQNNSTRIIVTAAALIAVVILLVGIFVISYRMKRRPDTVSHSDAVTVTPTDAVSPADTQGTTAAASSAETAATTGYVIDTAKNVNEYIRNPDYKSKYYVVVYTLSQSVVTYQKDANGGYTKLYKRLKCSTGVKGVTPTKEGVYTIVNKFRWYRLMGGVYGQYCCRFSEENGYYFHSVPYKAKDPSTMSNDGYDKLGHSASHGCIRLCCRDAKWMYEHLPVGTQVSVVWAEGPYGLDVPARNTDPRYDGWDPTDKWSEGNPYYTKETPSTTEDQTSSQASTSATAAPATSAPSTEDPADP